MRVESPRLADLSQADYQLPLFTPRISVGVTADWQVRPLRQRSNVAHIKDIRRVISGITEEADIAVIAGDLVDQQPNVPEGWKREANRICEEIVRHSRRNIPWLYLFGNHDAHSYNGLYEDNRARMQEIYAQIGMVHLQEKPYILEKEDRRIGIAGVKGGEGGFGKFRLEAFGEPLRRQLSDATAKEGEELGDQLKDLKSRGVEDILVVTHYAVTESTIWGENPKLSNALGSDILERVIEQYNVVRAVAHGHAHYGSPHGTTSGGIDVYNTALPLMLREDPKHPYLLYTL